MTSVKKKLLFALIPTVVVLVPLLVGGLLGYRFALRKMRLEFQAVAKSETLEGLVKKADRQQVAQAYYDPKQTLETMGDISYSVPTVMTPFVGIGPEPGQHHNAFIDSLQFRSDQEVVLPKPAGTFRIFITGGSTAFGSGAPSQDRTIGGYLNAILDKELSPASKLKYEVFTAACPSWTSTHERILIENRLVELQPDLVISFSGNNDVHWSLHGRNILSFRTPQEEFNWHILNWADGILRLQPMTDIVTTNSHPVEPALVADRLERNVELSVCALALTNVPYAFCLQPTLAVTKKSLTEEERQSLRNLKAGDNVTPGSNYFSQCYAKMDARLAKLKAANFTYVNLADAFDGEGSSNRIFIDSYHFGDKGNELVAREMFNRLRGLFVKAP